MRSNSPGSLYRKISLSLSIHREELSAFSSLRVRFNPEKIHVIIVHAPVITQVLRLHYIQKSLSPQLLECLYGWFLHIVFYDKSTMIHRLTTPVTDKKTNIYNIHCNTKWCLLESIKGSVPVLLLITYRYTLRLFPWLQCNIPRLVSTTINTVNREHKQNSHNAIFFYERDYQKHSSQS